MPQLTLYGLSRLLRTLNAGVLPFCRPSPVPRRRPHPKMRLGYREPRFGARYGAFATADDPEEKKFIQNGKS